MVNLLAFASVMRVPCSNGTGCGWQLSLAGSHKRSFVAIQILSWEEGVWFAFLFSSLS